MSERFVILGDENGFDFPVIYDKSTEKTINSKEDICTTLNTFYKQSRRSINEVERLYFDLEALDILLGELSWLVAEREAPNNIEEIREKSRELSKCITNVLYPKVENKKWIWE